MSVKIFFCYAHEDEPFLNKLKAYLRPLQRQGLIDIWHDRDISAGTEWEREISQHLNEAKIILLLVSPDFMNSDYCYSVEMKRALERHDGKEAIVIPVILRPIYWQGVLGIIQALPTDAKPVVDRYWHTLDEALYDVAEGIRKVVVQLGTKPVSPSEVLPSQTSKRESADISHTVPTPQPAKPLLSLKPEALSLLHTLTGHTHRVNSVAFSPDGQTVASGSSDKTIKLWNVTTGKEVRTLTEHTDVWSVAFSPDGQTLASSSYSMAIKLWNVTTGKGVRTLTGHTATVWSVAFSPDGQTLASGSGGNTIKLWNMATGKEVHTLSGHTNAVNSVAYSPDGQTVASGSDDTTIKLWNVATGKAVRTLTEYTSRVFHVAFSPDGQILASGSNDFTIKLWNVATGKEVRILSGHTNNVVDVAFSPDGQTVASGSSDKTIKLWNMATGKEVRTLTGHTDAVWSVAFSPDGQTLASGSWDTSIKIWGKK